MWSVQKLSSSSIFRASLRLMDKEMNYLLSTDVPVRRRHAYMYMMCWRDEIPAVSTDNREAARWTLSRLACSFHGSEVFVLKQPKQLTLGLPFAHSKPFEDTTVAMVSLIIKQMKACFAKVFGSYCLVLSIYVNTHYWYLKRSEKITNSRKF